MQEKNTENCRGLLATDPIAAYAKAGYAQAQFYYLRRHLSNPKINRDEKIRMLYQVIQQQVSNDLLQDFGLTDLYQLHDDRIMETVYCSAHFDQSLIAINNADIFCTLFCLFSCYLSEHQLTLKTPELLSKLLPCVANSQQTEKYEKILDIIEVIYPAITHEELTNLYQSFYPQDSMLDLTLRYLQKTPAVTADLKVGQLSLLNDCAQSKKAALIPLIWQRCLDQHHIQNYPCLIMLTRLQFDLNEAAAVNMIHQKFPQLLYGRIEHYRVPHFELLCSLLVQPEHLKGFSASVLLCQLTSLQDTAINFPIVNAILNAIIAAELSQPIHRESLMQILYLLNRLPINQKSHEFERIAEDYLTILLDIKLLLAIETDYTHQSRYFTFLCQQVFSDYALATRVIARFDQNLLIKRLCTAIPNYNELIVEFATIEQAHYQLPTEDRLKYRSEFQPKFLFDEAQHIETILAQFLNENGAVKPPSKRNEEIAIPVAVAISAHTLPYRAILPRDFPKEFYVLSEFPEQPPIAPTIDQRKLALRKLFLTKAQAFVSKLSNDRIAINPLNTKSAADPTLRIQAFTTALIANEALTLAQLQQECSQKLPQLLLEVEINQLLNGQEAPMANKVLFALVKILDLPLPLVSFYFNACYEKNHQPQGNILSLNF